MENQTPGDDLIDQLDDLRQKLNSLRERLEKSGVERTRGLRMSMGADCRFHRKSINLFIERDFLELRGMIKEVDRLFRVIEGE
jgi:hypothetical protein